MNSEHPNISDILKELDLYKSYLDVPYAIIDNQGTLLDVNSSWEFLFGSADNLINKKVSFLKKLPQKNKEFKRNVLVKTSSGEKTGIVNGRKVKNELWLLSWESQESSVKSDKERLLEALLISENKYRAMFENSKDTILLIQDDKIIDCNAATVNMLNCKTKSEVIGYTLLDYSPKMQPDGSLSSEKISLIFNDVLSNNHISLYWHLRRFTGELFHSEISFNLINIGIETIFQAVIRDITDRIIAEEKLKISEERFRKAFLASPNPITITSLVDGRLIEFNDNFTNISGYTREEAIGKTITELGGYESLEDRNNLLETLKKDGRIHDYEIKLFSKSRKQNYCILNGEIIDINNEPCLLTITTDITDRMDFQEALETSENKYRSLFEQASEAIFLEDIEGKIVDVNPMAEKLYGYTKDEFINISVDRILPPEKAESLDDFRTRLHKEGYVRYEGINIHKDGREIPVEVSARIVEIKNQKNILVFARDITDRISAFKILEESEHRYRTLFEQASDAVFLEDLEGNILDANSRAAEMLGYSIQELLNIKVYQLIPQETVKSLNSFVQTLLKDGYAFHAGENIRKNGSRINIEASARLIRIQNKSLVLVLVRDITERLNAQKALEESEIRYRNLFEKSHDALLLISPEKGIIDANRRSYETLGYTKEEFLNLDSQEILTLSKEELDYFRKMIIEGKEPTLETTAKMKNGQKIYLEMSGSMLDIEGKKKILIISRNITAKKEAEAKQKAAEQRLKKATDNLPHAMLVCQPVYDATGKMVDYILIDANPAALNMIQLPREKIIGVHFSRFHDINMHKEEMEHFMKVMQTGEADSFQFVVEGNENPYRAFNEIVWKISESYFVILVQDITLVERTKRKLSKTEKLLLNVVESMPSILITLDTKDCINQWNKSASNSTKIEKEEAFGKNIWRLVPELSFLKEKYRNVLSNIQEETLFQKKIDLGNGEKIYNIFLFPLITNGISGCVIRLDDITKIEVFEQQLRQSQKMETVGTLAGGIAHDFNNLLSGIVGPLSLLLYRISKNPEMKASEILSSLELMQNASERAKNLIANLLNLARKQESVFQVIKLNEITKDVFQICRASFNPDIKLAIDVPEDKNILIRGDSTQIEQVILNLAVNARDAMVEGGKLTFSIRMINDKDSIFLNSDGLPFVCLEIKDTGMGIEPEIIDQIFDPFFTTKPSGRGTGLGLAMVYTIIKNHNGHIRVESHKGIGTKFFIYFPISEKHEEMLPETTPIKVSSRKLNVLVIDDEEIVRLTAQGMLELLGHRVHLAKDGVEGIQIFKNKEAGEFDLVLLDYIMPIMNGERTFFKLRELDPALKIILSSGFEVSKQLKPHIDNINASFLSKPYQLRKLAHIIETMIKQD
ncbi:MAG: PAS domain S-box protein [Candidatus Coatesbacteria bacterium]|nr:PAS domain S-box protein [Candidatus Coatesbacteria bacterium]